MVFDSRRRLQRLLLLVLAGGILVGGVPRSAWGDPPVRAPHSAQIEADWLRQDAVRWMPASPRSRPKATLAAVSTRQDAAGGCDGVKDGTFGFHTSGDANPWWHVDLREVVSLGKIVVFNRCDGKVENRALQLKVLLSDDAKTWSQLYQHDGTTFFGQTDQKPLVVLAEGKKARFVRIQLPGQQYFHLDEVEVFGTVGDIQRNLALGKPADQSSASQWSTPSILALDEPASVGVMSEPEARTDQIVRRGLRLAENLNALGVNVEQQATTLRQVGRAWQALPEDASGASRRELDFQARWARRQMSLANPLLDFDDILFVKRSPGTFTHMSDQYYGWWSRPGGGLYVLAGFKSDEPQVRCLTEHFEPGSFLRPDLSFDGKKILFAYCKYFPGLRQEPDKLNKANVPEEAFYHLHEMNLDGSGTRRLTHGKYDDFDGRYLPNGKIVFLSTRRGQDVRCDQATAPTNPASAEPDCYVRCGGGPSRPVAVYTLHVMDGDGSTLKQISPFEMFEWTPSVDHNGRILYARWDYIDRHNMPYMSLWSTWPDGTNTRAVFGNFTTNPHCMFEARSIPGSQRLIFTASGHHANTGGSLVLLDPNVAFDGDKAMTRLSPEVAFPETEGWPRSYFANPYPLSENHYLVAWSNQEMTGWPGPPEPVNALGIYLYDAFGNLTLLHRDPTLSSMTPLPIRPRHRERILPELAQNRDVRNSRMLLADVYRGLPDIPRGTIRSLRLVGITAKTHPTMNFPSLGVTRDDPGKFVIGSVPVERDGSAYFHVPSGVPLFFQALDAEGRAVQTMRSATYVQPGQTTTCIGCHERRNTAPPSVAPLALGREPSKISRPAEGAWPLDYATLVQPVLDRHCIECHRPETEGSNWDLTPPHSYATLIDYGRPSLREHVMARYTQGRSIAGACASRTSPLIALLEQDHHDVELPPDAWERLYTWMDTYGQRRGSFSEEQQQELERLELRMTPLLQAR